MSTKYLPVYVGSKVRSSVRFLGRIIGSVLEHEPKVFGLLKVRNFKVRFVQGSKFQGWESFKVQNFGVRSKPTTVWMASRQFIVAQRN